MTPYGDIDLGQHSIQKNVLPFKTYTQQLNQGKKMTIRDSEA